MNYYILLLILILLVIANKKTIEGNSNNIQTLVSHSSKLSEIIDGTEQKIRSVLEIPSEEIDSSLKKTILKTEYIASQNNENNLSLVKNTGIWNDEILNLLQTFSEKYDETKIREYPGDKEEIKKRINENKEIDIQNYGYRHEILPKKYINKKYRDLKENYDTLINNNQCEEHIINASDKEKTICDIKIKEKEEIIETKNDKIKQLGIKIARETRIRNRFKKINAQLKNRKKIKRSLRWNAKPSGALYYNKFPLDETGHHLKCRNNLRKKSNDHDACTKLCKKTRGCNFIWQYKKIDRCCFKTRHTKKRGFRNNIPGWYTRV